MESHTAKFSLRSANSSPVGSGRRPGAGGRGAVPHGRPGGGDAAGACGVERNAATCPCSIWSSSAVPGTPSEPDTAAVEVGTKFRSDVDGYVTGVRFYKGTGNTGTHVGHLWATDGRNLGTVTFAGETASGWQQ